MQDLSSTSNIIALAATLVAIVAAVAATISLVKLRRVQRAQRVVLGDRDERDLVAHARSLEAKCEATGEFVQELLERLEKHAAETQSRLDQSFSHTAIVRYDAYGEMSGRQSHSIALLDDQASGLVLSTILHRDQARIYVKRLESGRADIELSPEESAVVEAALERRPGPVEVGPQLRNRAAS